MNFQIDVKPEKEGFHKVNLYIDGYCYPVTADKQQIYYWLKNGLIEQTKGQRHDETGKLITFDYPEGHDGAGVKYTSKVYECNEKKH